MKNHVSDDYKSCQNDFKVNTQTQSKNYKVNSLYEIILKNEERDTDYWYFSGGDHFLNYLDSFDDNDFKALVADIPDWTEDQQYILNECLKVRSLYNEQYRQTKASGYQSDLLPILFSITNDDQIKNDIFEHVELIAAGKPKSYHLLFKMKLWADKQLANLEKGLNAYKPTGIHQIFLQVALEKAFTNTNNS